MAQDCNAASFDKLLKSHVLKVMPSPKHVTSLLSVLLLTVPYQADAKDSYYVTLPSPSVSPLPSVETQQSITPATHSESPLTSGSSATSPYDASQPISEQLLKAEPVPPLSSKENQLPIASTPSRTPVPTSESKPVEKAEAPAAEPVDKVDNNVAKADPLFAASSAKSAAPVPPAAPAIAVATPPGQFSQEQSANTGPGWQTAFIKRLVGGDGTLTLVPGEERTDINVSDVVSLDQAVSLALGNNPEIKAAIEAVNSRYWDKAGAYSQYLPIVQVDLARGDERSRPAAFNDEFGNRKNDDRHFRQDRVLTVRQSLIDLTYISDIISGTDREKVSNYERKGTEDTITSDTINAYFRLIQSRMSIQLADQYKSYLDDLGQRMKARVEGGGASSADLDRIVSRASLAESARVEAQSEYDAGITEFQRLTGAMPLKIKVPDMLAPNIPDTIEEALMSACQQNPGYLASLKKVDVANDERNRAYSGLMPKVYAQYTSGYTYNAGGSAGGNPVDGVYPTQRTDSSMLVAQWVLNGGTAVTGGLSGSARARESTMQSLDIRQKMDQGIRVSYTALGASQKRIEVLQKTVEANERVVTGFEEQYKNGTRPLFDVLDAYEQLYNSRLNLMRVIFAYAQASYQVHLQMGDIVPSVLSTGGK